MAHTLKEVKEAKGVSFVHLNSRSLIKHFDEIDQTFLDGQLDVVVVTESWLHKNVGDSLVSSDLYNLVRLDRQVVGATGNVKT